MYEQVIIFQGKLVTKYMVFFILIMWYSVYLKGHDMYQYFNGYIIREGNQGISGEQLRTLYENVGLINHEMPRWQNEKFEIVWLCDA